MVTIVLMTPVGGKREHKFGSGAELAKFVWLNATHIYTSLKKTEQRD